MVDQYRCTYFYSPTNTRNSQNKPKYSNNNSYSSRPKLLAPPVLRSGVTCEEQQFDDGDRFISDRTVDDNATYATREDGGQDGSTNSNADTKALEEEQPSAPPPDNSENLEFDRVKSTVPENSDYQAQLKFSDGAVRKGFQRKVFSLLFIQLLITCGFISLFTYQRDLKEWTPNHPSFLIGSMIVVFVVFCLTFLTICSEAAGKKSPRNLLLLVAVTISYALLASTISAYINSEVAVYTAGFITTIPFILLLYSLQSKFKVTFWTGIVILLGAFFTLESVSYFVIYKRIVPEMTLLHLTFALTTSFIMACLIINEMARMLKQTHPFEISPKDYILGSLAIYIVILLLLTIILMIWDWGEKLTQGEGECCCPLDGTSRGGYGYSDHYYQDTRSKTTKHKAALCLFVCCRGKNMARNL